MMKALLFIFVVFVVILILTLTLRRGNKRFPWYEFFSRGRREGFSFREIRFLRQIAEQNKLQKPQSIYWSTRQLDRCLRPALERIKTSDDMDPAQRQQMIDKLMELRKKAEFNLPKYRKRIHRTSAILPRQKLVIKDPDYGTFVSWVIENSNRYIVVSRPAGQRASRNLEWAGRRVGVYFWRMDDAGYAFQTKVLEEIPHEEYPMLYLAHSGSLERVQKRESIRVGVDVRGLFYPVFVHNVEGANRVSVSSKGHSCRIVDVSDSGLAMVAGKGMKKSDRFKLDFNLTDEKRVVAVCSIVSVSKTSDQRVSRYHCQFVRIGKETKNDIQIFVYNIFGERDEEEEQRRPSPAPKPSLQSTGTAR
jgi:c-di-GMP-binding flagellar brake protein YcgR